MYRKRGRPLPNSGTQQAHNNNNVCDEQRAIYLFTFYYYLC